MSMICSRTLLLLAAAALLFALAERPARPEPTAPPPAPAPPSPSPAPSTNGTPEDAATTRYSAAWVEATLRDYAWPFARKYRALGLVATEPNSDWLYAYRYPSDCVRARRIVTNGGRLDQNPPPFDLGIDDQGRLIFTDQPDATLEYTVRVTDPSLFDGLFAEAFSWRMAAFLAPSLGRVQGAQNTALQMYARAIAEARTTAVNESQQDHAMDSEFVQARN